MLPPIGCERSNEARIEEAAVLPSAGGHVVLCVRGPTEGLWKMALSHDWLEDVLCYASTYWT